MFFLSLRRTFLAPVRLLGGILLSSTLAVSGPTAPGAAGRYGWAAGRRHGLLLANLLLARDGLRLTLAGARVGLGTLAVHGQAAPVPQALVAADLDLSPDVGLHLAPQVTLDLVIRF